MKEANPLFSEGPKLSSMPLAERMRPRTLDEFIGQDHIVGPGRLLRRAISADRISSLIFSGPPGTGKTTIARIIANTTQSEFLSLNAVLSGVAEIREAIQKATNSRDLYDRRTILFVDEVHRWNKAQQDALLPWVENGTIKLVGATTENPFFEVNAALVSRSRVFMLQSLNKQDLAQVVDQALKDPIRGYGSLKLKFEPEALDHLIDSCAGDARSLLNALELAVETTELRDGESLFISRQIAEESIQQKIILYDKDGDYHFDTISAFIKSIRGSDPDAALYWLARMIAGGEDPKFILRRLCISAAEDIGLANPNALVVANSCAQSFERVGLPEGQYFLSQATIYLATSPKSNSTMGYFDALSHIKDSQNQKSEVPLHLRDSTRDGPDMGHGRSYIYPHAYRDHWVAQNYLPKDLREQVFYQPSDQGYESEIRAEVQAKKWAQLALGADMETENFTAQPRDKVFDSFVRRSESQLDPRSVELALALINTAGLARHHRIALVGNKGLFMVPYLLRAVPEGLLSVIVPNQSVPGLNEWLTHTLPNRDIETWQVTESPDNPPEFAFVWDWAEFPLLDRTKGGTKVIGFSRLRSGNTRPSTVLSDPDLRAEVAKLETLWLGEPVDAETTTDEIKSQLPTTAIDALSQAEPHELDLAIHNIKRSITIDRNRLSLWTSEGQEYYSRVTQQLGPDSRQRAIESWQALEESSFPWVDAFVIIKFLTK